MVTGMRITGIALVIFCLALLPSAASATAVQDAYPEKVPLDLDAGASGISFRYCSFSNSYPYSFRCSLSRCLRILVLAWLHFRPYKRVLRNNVLENETRNAVLMHT